MSKTVLIDASTLSGGVTGAGRYSYELLNHLLPISSDIDFRILVPEDEHWGIEQWSDYENTEIKKVDLNPIGFRRQIRFLRESFDFDLFHSHSSYLPIFINGEKITTVHDIIFIKYPSALSGPSKLKEKYVRHITGYSVGNSDKIITVSEHTAKDLVSEFGIRRDDIVSIPLGPGKVNPEIEGKPPVESPYLLFVGTLRRHKNVQTLIKGYQLYRDEVSNSNCKLVIAGSDYGNRLTKLRGKVKGRYEKDVHFLGQVSDEKLARLYKHATAFVFPTLYEGFGIPPLEAMGYSLPVMVSDRASIPEVVGDAGIYFDPTNANELAKKIENLLQNETLQTKLRKKSEQRFSMFSWERTAQETLRVYKDALALNTP